MRFSFGMTARRVLSLLLCAVLTLTMLPAVAQSLYDLSYMTFEVSYQDAQGNAQTAYPSPVFYDGYDGSFWVNVPQEAIKNGLTLHIEDMTNQFASYSPANGETVFPVDAGSSLTTGVPVDILCFDASGKQVYTLRLYVSTIAAEPEAPVEELPVEPQTITVYYRSFDNMDVASSQQVTLEEGKQPVKATPKDLLEGYTLSGDDVQYVTVDAYGATPYEVIFYYDYTAPAPSVEPVYVPIHYYDSSFQPVADDDVKECVEGTNNIEAAPRNLKENYELIGDAVQQVNVTADGAYPTEVVFFYQYVAPATEIPTPTPDPTEAPTEIPTEAPTEIPTEAPTEIPTATPAPAPKIAFVNVAYVYEADGQQFYAETATCAQGIENLITVKEELIPDNYQVRGENYVNVTVDENGVAYPDTVTFYFYQENTQVASAFVTVLYQTADGKQVASPTEQQCELGTNKVYAEPKDLQAGYDLIDSTPKTVTMYDNGALSEASVTFLYQENSEETPEPDIDPDPTDNPPEENYVITPMSGEGYPKADGVNLRSTPTTVGENVLAKVNKADQLTLLGTTVNSKGETWYYVSVAGMDGFLRDSFVQLPTQAPTSTPEPTAEPTPIPDSGIIDRFGEINSKSVNFRSSQKASGSNKIKTLYRGDKVWVYDVETVNDTKWYTVRVNGKDGYIVAEYVTVYSQEESDAYQATLPTQMPTQTPQATRVPTATPFETPSPTPQTPVTQAPTELVTPTPAPYTGYGLTKSRAAVRYGISQSDETIIETVEANTLVYISAQTYVGGECWDSVSVFSSGNGGFMQDDRLRRITSEEAKYYLDQLNPETAKPTATPVPFEGYAKTLGDNVPLRSFMDTNAQILKILSANSVVTVYSQEYVDGEAWCLVQYGQYFGYVRRDMIQQMNQWEIDGYLESLKTPTPTPAVTPTAGPATGDTMSSYGYVSKDKVNLRQKPTKSSTSLRLMDKYAFALVLGTEVNAEGTWYHILQNGTEGYVMSGYFKSLTISELTDFLMSDEYLSAGNNSSSSGNGGSTNNSGSNGIQSVEDYNQGIWQNPALQASYEPFNPYATPTPNPADVVTATPSVSPSPTPTLEPLILPTQAPNSTGGSFPTGLVVFLILLLLAGGGLYAYTIHKRNERRRAAMRAQQQRRAQQAASQQPAMRVAPGNPAQPRPYPQGAAPYRPAQNGAPRPGERPVSQNAPMPQATQKYTPVQPNDPYQAQPPVSQQTINYRPVTRQDQDAFRRPESNNGQTNPYNPQATQNAFNQSVNRPTAQPAKTYTAQEKKETPLAQPQKPAQPSTQPRVRRSERFHHDDTDNT